MVKVKRIAGILSFLIFLAGFNSASLASAASSASYSIDVAVLDVGGGTSESSSYRLLGKGRDMQTDYFFSGASNLYLGSGFLRSIFYSSILGPFVTWVIPPFGYNDRTVLVIIKGANFRLTGITTVELVRPGETTIVATDVIVENANTIMCTFDLDGALPGSWSVFVNSDGYVSTSGLSFEVREAKIKLEIVGAARNYPNPFDPGAGPTLFIYTLTKDADIVLSLYDMTGKKVWRKKCPSGTEGGWEGENRVEWSGRNAFGAEVPNGVYLCQITTSSGKKLAVVKAVVFK